LVPWFLDLSTIYTINSKLTIKRKGKSVNSLGPGSAQPAQHRAESVHSREARAPAAALTFLQNGPRLTDYSDRGSNTIAWVTDSLPKRPLVSIPSHGQVLDGARARSRAPASKTGRRGPRPALPSGGHKPGSTPTVSPKWIARVVTYSALPTETAEAKNCCSCSRQWVAI
jgi:hypothetical protein